MKCKKSLMGLAALLIVVFHFYIPFLGNQIEMTLYRASYIGVDIFFFVSAYSLASRPMEWKAFLLNRLRYIYLPFVALAVLGAVYGKWTIARFFSVICGVEFFQKGGGSFLWFFIAIMLLYLVSPLLVGMKERMEGSKDASRNSFARSMSSLGVMLLIWLLLAVILQYGFQNKTLFILVNRLPIFFLGMHYDALRRIMKQSLLSLSFFLVVLVAGGWLIARYGSLVRLTKPFWDMYYIVAIPFVLALIALWDMISRVSKVRNLPLQWVGQFTMELYGIQMIVGFDWETKLLKATGANKPLTFALTLILLLVTAFGIHLIFQCVHKGVDRLLAKRMVRLKGEQ